MEEISKKIIGKQKELKVSEDEALEVIFNARQFLKFSKKQKAFAMAIMEIFEEEAKKDSK